MNTLTAEKRDLGMKAKKLRREGFVIGNLFGRDIENSVPLKLDPRETAKFLKHNKKGAHITLNVDNKNIDAMIKEINYDAMKREISFINFQALVADEKIHATTPVILLHEDAVQGGIVEQALSEIEYKAYPADLLDTVEIDLSAYRVGDLIHVKDLELSKNTKITLVTSPDTLVVNIAQPEMSADDTEDETETATEA